MNVCVIGTKYVGLVTVTCLAHTGYHVICVDKIPTPKALSYLQDHQCFPPR